MLSFLVAIHIERSREIEEEIREKKIPIYENTIRLFFESIFCNDSIKINKGEKEITKEMRDFSIHRLIWSPDEVFLRWTDLVRALQKAHPEQISHDWLVKKMPLGDFLLAVRKDIGHRNRQIRNVDVWSPFVNDLDPIIMEMKQKGPRLQ